MCTTEERFGFADTDIAEAAHRAEVAEETVEHVTVTATDQIEVAIEFMHHPVDQFDHVVGLLAELDRDASWEEATDSERPLITSKSRYAAHPPSTSHSTKSGRRTEPLRTS